MSVRKLSLGIFVAVAILVVMSVIFLPFRNHMTTIEGTLPLISSSEIIGVNIYRPDYTSFSVHISENFLSILQTERWEMQTGSWSRGTVRWDEVILIGSMADGLRIYIEKDIAVIYYEYVLPIVQRRYTLYSIPIEISEELLAYVLGFHS